MKYGQKSIRSLPGPGPGRTMSSSSSSASSPSIMPAILRAKAARKAHSKPTPVEYTLYLISALYHLVSLSTIAFNYCSAHMAPLVVCSLGYMSLWADSAFAFIDLLISPPDVDPACFPASSKKYNNTWSEQPACGSSSNWFQSFVTSTKATLGAFLHNQLPADDSSLTERMMPLEPGIASFPYESHQTHSSSSTTIATNGASLEIESKPALTEASFSENVSNNGYQNDLEISEPDTQSIESFALDFSDDSVSRRKFKRKTRRRNNNNNKKHRKSTDAYSSSSSISSDILPISNTSPASESLNDEGSGLEPVQDTSIAFHKVEHSPIESCSFQSVDSIPSSSPSPPKVQPQTHLIISSHSHHIQMQPASSSTSAPSLYPYLISRSISSPLQLAYFHSTNISLKHSQEQVTSSGLAWSVPPHLAHISAWKHSSQSTYHHILVRSCNWHVISQAGLEPLMNSKLKVNHKKTLHVDRRTVSMYPWK